MYFKCFYKKTPAEAEGLRNNRFHNRKISGIVFLCGKMQAGCVAGSPALLNVRAADPLLCSNGTGSPTLPLFQSVFQTHQSIFPQDSVPLSLKHFCISYKYLTCVFRNFVSFPRNGRVMVHWSCESLPQVAVLALLRFPLNGRLDNCISGCFQTRTPGKIVLKGAHFCNSGWNGVAECNTWLVCLRKKTFKNSFFLQKSWFANSTYILTPIKGAHWVQGGSWPRLRKQLTFN